jgi:hypothetical protein
MGDIIQAMFGNFSPLDRACLFNHLRCQKAASRAFDDKSVFPKVSNPLVVLADNDRAIWTAPQACFLCASIARVQRFAAFARS